MRSRLRHLLIPMILRSMVDEEYRKRYFMTEGGYRPAAPRVIPTPKKELREFDIKGNKILAYSRKDAIKRLKHRKA